MTHPTPDQIDVAVGALDAESRLWTDQSHRLNGCGGAVTDLRITDYDETLLFDEFLAAYNEVSDTFAQHCTGGAVETFDIGLRLLTVAQVYAAEEQANLHAWYNLY